MIEQWVVQTLLYVRWSCHPITYRWLKSYPRLKMPFLKSTSRAFYKLSECLPGVYSGALPYPQPLIWRATIPRSFWVFLHDQRFREHTANVWMAIPIKFRRHGRPAWAMHLLVVISSVFYSLATYLNDLDFAEPLLEVWWLLSRSSSYHSSLPAWVFLRQAKFYLVSFSSSFLDQRLSSNIFSWSSTRIIPDDPRYLRFWDLTSVSSSLSD